MKKGCFVKLIFFITVFAAVLVFLVQKRFNDIVYKPGLKVLNNHIIEEINNHFYYVKESSEKDSVESMMKNYINRVGYSKKIKKTDLEQFMNLLSEIVKDSVISKNDLNNFMRFVQKNKTK